MLHDVVACLRMLAGMQARAYMYAFSSTLLWPQKYWKKDTVKDDLPEQLSGVPIRLPSMC